MWNIQVPITDSARYVARFGSEPDLSGKGKGKAEATEIIKKAQDEKLTSGKSPSGTAAIYIAALKNVEQKIQREVAEISDLTEVTVRNRYKELAEELDICVNV